jgi:hypothetical protein
MTLGPLLGGVVSSYKEQYTQNSALFRKFPYLPPAAAAAAFPAVYLIVNILFFPETLHNRSKAGYIALESPTVAPREPMTARQLLHVRPVRAAILNYNFLCLVRRLPARLGSGADPG